MSTLLDRLELALICALVSGFAVANLLLLTTAGM
jgi:hypothetical protein